MGDKMKKIIIGLLLLLVIIAYIYGTKDEEKDKEKEPVSCSNYIENYLENKGWERTAPVIFTNQENNYLVWNISSNVFVFMNDTGHVELFINNDQIFVGNDYSDDQFEQLREEMDYDDYKELADSVHKHFDDLGCPLRGKENNILTEEYQNVYIEE